MALEWLPWVSRWDIIYLRQGRPWQITMIYTVMQIGFVQYWSNQEDVRKNKSRQKRLFRTFESKYDTIYVAAKVPGEKELAEIQIHLSWAYRRLKPKQQFSGEMKEGVNITAKVKMINSSQELVIILWEYSVYISHLAIEIFHPFLCPFRSQMWPLERQWPPTVSTQSLQHSGNQRGGETGEEQHVGSKSSISQPDWAPGVWDVL